MDSSPVYLNIYIYTHIYRERRDCQKKNWKNFNRHFSKEDIYMTFKCMKNAQASTSEKYKLTVEGNTYQNS